MRDGTNGLIIAPGNPAALAPHLREAARRNIPVVCVVTDAPESQRLTSVSADPFTVGAVAGELLARFLPGGGQVAFFTGWLATQDHADKLRGFESSLGSMGPRSDSARSSKPTMTSAKVIVARWTSCARIRT